MAWRRETCHHDRRKRRRATNPKLVHLETNNFGTHVTGKPLKLVHFQTVACISNSQIGEPE